MRTDNNVLARFSGPNLHHIWHAQSKAPDMDPKQEPNICLLFLAVLNPCAVHAGQHAIQRRTNDHGYTIFGSDWSWWFATP